jgi:hypothetical protein
VIIGSWGSFNLTMWVVRAVVRIIIMERTDLRVKWSIEDGRRFVLDQKWWLRFLLRQFV